MPAIAFRRVLPLLVGSGLVASFVAAAAAQGIPEKEINRDLIRRALLDTCVYGEAAKEGAVKDKVVDACQCASFKVMKTVKEEEISKISSDRSIPDEMYRATTDAYGSCVR
jgi:predicted nicotinamide N-methyase